MSSDNIIIGGQQQPGSGEAGLAGAGSDAGALVKDTTTENFAADVIDASRQVPILVDFWAPWWAPASN